VKRRGDRREGRGSPCVWKVALLSFNKADYSNDCAACEGEHKRMLNF